MLLALIVKEKLNNYTKEKWEESLKGTNVPTFDDIVSFLEQRALIDTSQFSQKQGSFPKSDSHKLHSKSNFHSKSSQSCMKTSVESQSNTTKLACPICGENHMPSFCLSFQKMSPQERYLEIKKSPLCHNCLKNNLRTFECRAPTCKKCQKRHHTLLHFERQSAENSNISKSETATQLLSFQSQATPHVLLGTAIVDIKNSKGEFQPCRVLLDSCSQCNSITEKVTASLELKKRRVDIQLKGAQNLCSTVNYSTTVIIAHRDTQTLKLICRV